MTEKLAPELCVIGAGAAGLSVAAAAAAFGVPVVLIEKGRMGGDCLNTGCVPSKALIAAAKRAETFRTSGPFGIAATATSVDFGKVHDHIHRVIETIAPNDSKERFAGMHVRVIEGEARFRDPKTVVVGDEPNVAFEIAARRFVIATGSRPAVPQIPGLDQCEYSTNENIFESRERPSHLIVIGAGPIGIELAQAFRRLGAEVTVLEKDRALPKEDPECAAVLLDALAREGITIRTGVNIARVRQMQQRTEVVLANTGETIQGTRLLIATGRQPDVASLNLDAAGVAHGPSGISVDKRFRTKNKRIYAVGDAAGLPQFTHAASHEASLLVRHLLFRLPIRFDADKIPRVTFTEPEIAHVGLTEVQARAKHRSIRVLRWPYHENDRAQAERQTRGHVKAVTDNKGWILGATIVGAAASEQIALWSLAIGQRLNIRALAELVVPYPTYNEVNKRAAISFFAAKLSANWLRRLIQWFVWLT